MILKFFKKLFSFFKKQPVVLPEVTNQSFTDKEIEMLKLYANSEELKHILRCQGYVC